MPRESDSNKRKSRYDKSRYLVTMPFEARQVHARTFLRHYVEWSVARLVML